MRSFIRIFMFGIVLLLLASCGKKMTQQELPASIRVGDSYYTQFVIRYEKDTHVTTNYRRGASIPVNTEVRLIEVTNKTILVELANSNLELRVKNVEKFTKDDIFKAFDKLFKKTRVNLSTFSKMERGHIKSGTVAKGMRKKAVIVAIGYPPQHATHSLESDQWTYWSSRFNKFIVHFSKGKVVRIQD